jgi:hypothetical protein
MAALRLAGKLAAGAVPVVEMARLGLPALVGLLTFAVLVLGTVCWVLGSDARCERLARVLQAWRAGAGSRPSAVSSAIVSRTAPTSHSRIRKQA